MQKDYLTPTLQLIVMDQEDVITGSVVYGTEVDDSNKDHFIDWSDWGSSFRGN